VVAHTRHPHTRPSPIWQAYDVLFFGGEADILRWYTSLQVPTNRVLFGAENGCFPDWGLPFGQKFCTEGFPAGLGEYRYINSGVWMGRASAAFTLLTDAISFTPGRGVDDQQVISHLYVHRPSAFQLDRDAVLIQAMHLVSPTDVAFAANKSTNSCWLTNKKTGSQPVILHFNGGSKNNHDMYRKEVLSRRGLPGFGEGDAACVPPTLSIYNGSGGGDHLVKNLCPKRVCGMQQPWTQQDSNNGRRPRTQQDSNNDMKVLIALAVLFYVSLISGLVILVWRDMGSSCVAV